MDPISFGALLFMASVVAMLCARLGMPYSVGLVLAGFVLAIAKVPVAHPFSKELIFNAFLPPLVFEAALYIRWRELRRDLPVVLTLAIVGVLLAGGVTAAGLHLVLGWDWPSAAVFGLLIAATDPVSVIASFKHAGVHGRLRLLVESESLLNDGVAAVAVGVAVIVATGGEVSAASLPELLIVTVGGGIGTGALVAIGVLLLAGRTEDHLVEITLTTLVAYGSFLLAERFHMSGVLASLTAGLVVGNYGVGRSISPGGADAVRWFWEYAAFIVNSLIFILMGSHVAEQPILNLLWPAVAAIGLVTLGRAVAVYPCCAIFSRSALRVERAHQHVLFWGGLRGALALALALGLPLDVPHHDDIVTLAFAVVAFSIFVQGLSMEPLLRMLRQIAPKSPG